MAQDRIHLSLFPRELGIVYEIVRYLIRVEKEESWLLTTL